MLDASTGALVWTRDIAADSGAPTPQWGFSASPLVERGLVIVFAGGDAKKSLLAYQEQTGELVWTTDAGVVGYSSPQRVELAGRTLVAQLGDRQLTAVDPADGKIAAFLTLKPGVMMPVTQPQPVGDGHGFIVQAAAGVARVDLEEASLSDATGPASEARGPEALALGAEAATNEPRPTGQKWWSKGLKTSLSDFVVAGDAIYGFDDGIFCCLDLQSGKRRWKQGRFGHGQVLLLEEQQLLLVVSESGEVILLEANPQRLVELGRDSLLVGKTWNMPSLARGRLFVRNGEEMVAVELPR